MKGMRFYFAVLMLLSLGIEARPDSMSGTATTGCSTGTIKVSGTLTTSSCPPSTVTISYWLCGQCVATTTASVMSCAGSYSYQTTISGLTSGATYYITVDGVLSGSTYQSDALTATAD